MKVTHAIVSGPDQATAEYTTRCGLKATSLGMGQYNLVDPTKWEAGKQFDAAPLHLATCPGCRVKLKPIEQKVLRLMLDYPNRVVVFSVGNNSFGWVVGKELKIYGRRGFYDTLYREGLIGGSNKHNVGLTRAGRTWAVTLPKVKEDF